MLCATSLDGVAKGLGCDQIVHLWAVQQFGHRGHIDIQDVEQQTARRRIGTGVLGIVGEHRMQRIETYHIGSAIGSQLYQLAQVTKITDAPICRRAQQVKLRGNAPQPPPIGKHRWQPALTGRNHQGHRRTAGLDREVMVAPRQVVFE